ncbi:unnamed protein product [Pedinophyceae sp. YPF-701]|nr:unnamed protein product [Pedinophyceae sp. YPF-701]
MMQRVALRPRCVGGSEARDSVPARPRIGAPEPRPHASSRRAALGASAALGAVAAVGVVGAGAAVAAGVAPAGIVKESPQALTRRGMKAFQRNRLDESLECFDRVLELSPGSRPYMWQRGLTLYYLRRFEEGAQQFRADVAVNPNDTEEAIWTFLCEAQLPGGALKARENFLRVGEDSRPVMRAAYAAFMDGCGPGPILEAAGADKGGRDRFYALLYHGLYHEAEGDDLSAQRSILAAAMTPYARHSGDYMAALSRVHCVRRGWAPPAAFENDL